MNRLVLLLMVVLCASCSHSEFEYLVDKSSKSDVENDIQLETEYLNQKDSELMAMREASIILSEYIKIEDDTYILDITMEEAKDLGVSEAYYKRICDQIDTVNTTIVDAKKNGNKINLPNIQKLSKEYKDPNHKVIPNRSIFNPSRASIKSGIIKTLDDTPGSDQILVDYGATTLKLLCGTNWNVVTTYICTVDCFGILKSETKAGSLYCRTSFEFNLPASGSGTKANLSFKTSDSMGGFCIWNLI